jgi:fibronectin type 3 domain-containing protein
VFATSKVTANTTLYAKWIALQVTGLKVISAGYNSLKLTWTASSGANFYEIYRASSSAGTYYLVTTIAAISVPTYTSTALGTGTTYYFKVRAYSLSGTSKTYNNYSTIAYAKPLPSTPTGFTATAASYSSTKLSWTAVTGANGYSVYRATTLTGAYSLLATVTTNTYTKTALATGSTYYYKVNAYRLVGTAKVYGSQTAALGARVVPPTPVSLAATSPSYNSIKLTWGAVYGANGYSVYRATSATGTYALLTTITTNTYTNVSLATGTTYYYKVNAYRLVGTTKVYGSQCAAVGRKVVPATITTLTAVRYSATSIKISWGAMSGASGYEIYRSTSATGTYTLVTTLTAISYINTSLVTGTTYYYKVRAYRLVGTTKVYADFSAVKYAKP